MIQLRDYQQTAVDEIRSALAQYKRCLFCAPTGSGKGFLLGFMASEAAKKGRKVLILSDRTEILKQNIKYVANFQSDVSFINPKQRTIPDGQIVVAMTQTMKRRVEKQEWADYLLTFDFVIIDEAQSCVSDYIHHYLKPNVWLLGLSGSPQRYGKMTQLGSLYAALVETVTIKELINLGYLSKAKLYSIAAPKMDDVPIDYNSGEYNQKALAKKFEDRTLYKGIVSEYIRLVNGKKALCFCVSATQTISVTEEFNRCGVSAKYVLSSSFDSDEVYSGERSEIFEQFKRGEFTVLVNCGVAVAGLDIPDIEVVIANYATMSLVKWLQSLGRGARVTDTKHEFYILDAGMNYERLGRYEDDRIFCLWHNESAGGGIQQMKLCDSTKPDRNGKYGCNTLIPNTCKVCPKCGKILVDEKWDYILHLEEVKDEAAENSIESYVTARRLDGWSIPRILIGLCTANTDNMRKAFIRGYLALSPNKTEKDAGKYYYVFMKQFGDKIKRKKVV